MAFTDVTVRQKKGSRGSGILVVRTDQTTTINLNGVEPTANATLDETVVDMAISEIQWNTASTDTWTIDRGGVTVLQIGSSSTGHLDFTTSQMRLEKDSELTSDIGITKAGAGTSFLIMKVHKSSGA